MLVVQARQVQPQAKMLAPFPQQLPEQEIERAETVRGVLVRGDLPSCCLLLYLRAEVHGAALHLAGEHVHLQGVRVKVMNDINDIIKIGSRSYLKELVELVSDDLHGVGDVVT